jgi:UDP-N-acetyl-D-mannosaminuronic acid dehydrogenase
MRADRFKRPTIAFLGIAGKLDVNDLRESPALEIFERAAGLFLNREKPFRS